MFEEDAAKGAAVKSGPELDAPPDTPGSADESPKSTPSPNAARRKKKRKR
jgi:hypothetical protein